jgi:hydroxyethylthiazole kinase-like uncharacterized protein yjeF
MTERLKHLLRVPAADDNKYTRGVVGFVTGSEAFPGAALLGVQAAARSSVGMIRYVGPSSVQKLIIEARPEVVLGFGKVDAWVLGSGVDPADGEQVGNIATAVQTGARCIVDAGALFVVDYVSMAAQSAILTPHAGELARLLDAFGRHFELDYEAVQAAAAMTRQIVILKGNTSLIAHPNGEVVAVGPNAPELSTAGTGDVLAGVLGALVAANPGADLVEVAELGVLLHSEAASRAATQGPVVAMDVVDSLRAAVSDWSAN